LPVVAIVDVYIQFFNSHELPWSLLFPAVWLFFALSVALPTRSGELRGDDVRCGIVGPLEKLKQLRRLDDNCLRQVCRAVELRPVPFVHEGS